MLYAGRAGKLGLPAFEFIRATGLHDRNILMFRDVDGADYRRGLSPDVPTMAAFIDWQMTQRSKHFPHVTETYCVGTSAGAFAAIASGYFLRVRTVWAFGPPRCCVATVHRDPDADEVSRRCWDLRELLSDGNNVTEYRIYYCEDYQPDREVAAELAGCPGVSLFPQPGSVHTVVNTMFALGRLEGIVGGFAPVVGP
jgi:hypothetical protein